MTRRTAPRLSLDRRRAIARALEAHVLTYREIAAEVGCGVDAVLIVAHDLRGVRPPGLAEAAPDPE